MAWMQIYYGLRIQCTKENETVSCSNVYLSHYVCGNLTKNEFDNFSSVKLPRLKINLCQKGEDRFRTYCCGS
jgi:hypothetical protein